MGWAHGALTGVIIAGGTRAIAGVKLFRLGTDWAQASVPASSVTNSAKCPCHLLIFISRNSAPAGTITLSNRCGLLQITEVKGWLLSSLDHRSRSNLRIGATLTNQGPFDGREI